MTVISIIGPKFFGYTQSIRDEVSRRGFQTDLYEEFQSSSTVIKVLYRLGFFNFFTADISKYHLNILSKIVARGTTDLFLINPEIVDRKFVCAVKSRNINVHLYMWDSAANKKRFVNYLDLLHSKSSFDPVDCQKLEMVYVGLFSDKTLRAAAENCKKDVDIAFYGTLHSSRTELLCQVREYCEAEGFSYKFLLYYHARWLFYLKCLMFPQNLQLLRSVSYKNYTKDQIDSLIASARFVLDLHHPSQNGLTMRTFEVLFSTARLITLNPMVYKCLPKNFHHRVVLIEAVDDLYRNPLDMDRELNGLDVEDKYYLSVGRFVDELLGNAKITCR